MERWKDLNRLLKWLYMGLMGVLWLWYPYHFATMTSFYNTPMWIQIARIAAAILAVYLGKLWKDRPFWFLAAFLVLVTVRLIPGDMVRLRDNRVREALSAGVWFLVACYGMGRSLDRKEIKRLLTGLLIIWTISMIVFCVIGLYAVWTDQQIPNLRGRISWKLYYGNIMVLFHPNVAAGMIYTSAMVLLCVMLNKRQKWIWLPGLPALQIFALVISLSGCRTMMICFAMSSAGMIAITLSRYMQAKKVRAWRTRIAGAACFTVLFSGLLFLWGPLGDLFYTIKQRGGLFISSASAEGIDAIVGEFTRRWLNGGIRIFSGREGIWQTTFEYFSENPKILLLGESIYRPMRNINALVNYTFAHAHCLYLEIVLESGIPGLLLLLGFGAILIRRGLRSMRFRSMAPRWIALLSVLVFVMLIGEIDECCLILRQSYTPTQGLIFLCMGLICAEGQKKKP